MLKYYQRLGIDIDPANIITAQERLNAPYQREIGLYGFEKYKFSDNLT